MTKPRPLAWLREAPAESRKSLLAASLGWMLDAFDVMLYAMVLASLMSDLGLAKGTAGLLGSLTLLASAAGGLLFGLIADRYGRVRAMMGSILIYSIFTAACGLSSSLLMLAVFRVLLGLGMGGEWASGAALVSETWPAAHRAKALGIVQSSWAVGYALAAAVTALVLPALGWRAVFFVGALPGLLVFWVRRRVREPEIWRAGRKAGPPSGGFREIFRGGRLRPTILLTAMNACTLFGWWGLNLWLPAYLSLAAGEGGVGLGPRASSMFIVFMQAGMWLGYISFGYVADRIGRKKAYVGYLLAAAVSVAVYAVARGATVLFFLGPVVAFFGTGHFTGFGALTAETYPTAIRATAQGFTYNTGRIASAAAPFIVGSLAQTRGFGAAFLVVGAAFLLAAVLWIWIPENKSRELA